MTKLVLGLDIGGANLKAATSAGQACTHPFELWRQPANLAGALADLIGNFPVPDLIAVTMTGELCDCFTSRRQGVLAILDAVETAARDLPIAAWGIDGRFRSITEARAAPIDCAAANWLALATYAGRLVPHGPSLVIDLGSTTADIVPILDGVPIPTARADIDRLRTRELIYTGIRRTPLCALLRGEAAAEFFATTQDAYLVLGQLPEEPDNCQTANGRPATRAEARLRLAHMLCADCETCPEESINRLAEDCRQRQAALLRRGVDQVVSRLPRTPEAIVIAGSGEFLLQQFLRDQFRFHSLTETLGAGISQAACAHAVATLAISAFSHPMVGQLCEEQGQ
jgi:probable H4MPT-linked C1 transfer pathway protein